MRRARQRTSAIFAWPVAIGVASAAGLAAGLMGEAGWDWLAWTGLALPVLAAVKAR